MSAREIRAEIAALAAVPSKIQRRARAIERLADKLRDCGYGESWASTRAKEIITAREEARPLRHWAGKIGLAYWPALRHAQGTDVAAFVAAERRLIRLSGGRYGDVIPAAGGMSEGRHHGGWDSHGHHGLSPRAVIEAWRAAGCRDTPKFGAQIRALYAQCSIQGNAPAGAGLVARKGDTLPQYQNFARAALWLQRNNVRVVRPLARRCVMDLGRVSAEARWIALRPFLGQYNSDAPLRSRELDWAGVALWQRMISAAPPERRPVLRAAGAGRRRAATLLGLPVDAAEETVASTMLGVYPGYAPPLRLVRRAVLGTPPAVIAAEVASEAEMTRREVAEWWADGAPTGADLAGWLGRRVSALGGVADFLHSGIQHRSCRVLRWIEAMAGRLHGIGPLLTDRTTYVPGHGERRFRYLDILDEIADVDVVSIRDGADTVFGRAAARIGEAAMLAASKDHRVLCDTPAWGRKLPTGLRLLRTPAELAREGQDLQHCVGGYGPAVEQRQCIILAVETRMGRSTVEITPDGREIRQHHGERNGYPPKRNAALVTAWHNRILRGGR